MSTSTSTGDGGGDDEPRHVIATGQTRFQSSKIAPPQPNWEVLSDRVVCVLAMNPGPCERAFSMLHT